jgi:RES domain-containing protein
MLEYFVHLDPEDPPDDLVLATAEVPENLPQERVETSALPANWRESPAPPRLAEIGDEFVKKAENCVLIVPSPLAIRENNWLINLQHSEFKQITVNSAEPLSYDPRLFCKAQHARKH